MKRIAVIGAGVAGLTTALAVVESCASRQRVGLFTKDTELETTSSVAAAFWYPYMARPQDKVAIWGAHTFSKFEELATEIDSGVTMTRFFEVTAGVEKAWWKDIVRNFSQVSAQELPPGYSSGISFDNPIIDSSIYLPYLKRRLLGHGVNLIYKEVMAIADLFSEFDVVINCSGLGARSLADDTDLHPARGQIVCIKRHAQDNAVLDVTSPHRFAHCIPRRDDTILGGTYEENVESSSPSESEGQEIIERCKALLPRLNSLPADEILQSRCGFRPVRSEIRVEREEPTPGKFVIHNYGHGGAGFSMSWGCAADVCRLLAEIE